MRIIEYNTTDLDSLVYHGVIIPWIDDCYWLLSNKDFGKSVWDNKKPDDAVGIVEIIHMPK